MEPLRPILRDALIAEHPGLTQETIDRSEELLAQRFYIDPEAEPLRLQEIDRERAELIAREMPRFHAVMQKLSTERAV